MGTKRVFGGMLVFAVVVGFGCGKASDPVSSKQTQLTADGKLGVMLKVLVARNPSASKAHKAMPRQLITLRSATIAGKQEVVLDVLIQADKAAAAKIKQLGGDVRTVTKSGILTASVPLNKIKAIAALTSVTRIEAAKRMRKYNDLSNAKFTAGCESATTGCTGMNNSRTKDGTGVIVGVIDSGLDYTHGDFIDADGNTRILYYWDQSDVDDDAMPAGTTWSFSYGHEYERDDIQDALDEGDATWDPETNTGLGTRIKASAQDTDGHGTHVTGTAAGDGSASGYAGVAPKADIIFVKFDFDGDRNSDAAIIDGVDYIFKRAAEAGLPAVINMSLGSDFGPHDGTTLEERGISDLTGKGKVVVVAAGNPGNNNWSQRLGWGFAMHGSGQLGTDDITFRFPTYAAGADNYVFFDIWYPAGNKCRVRIITPTKVVYPLSTSGASKRTWVTGSSYTGFNTSEGALLVGNGGDQLEWGTTTSDDEIYVEISDYWGVAPATGTFTIRIEPADTKSTCSGTYHAWYGVSSNLVKGWQIEDPRDPTPRFGGRESDNAVTIGCPASADKVIAVAAYQTRNEWQYVYGTGTGCSLTPATQRYQDVPIGYYDPFAIGELAYFSARGPRRDGALKPEIAAPGVGIASSLSHFVVRDEFPNRCKDYWDGGPYHFGTNRVLLGTDNKLEGTVIQGTSMACPNATGAVALMLEVNKDADDACLRQVFAAKAKHDGITDTYAFGPDTAGTDTDSSPTAESNNDWGHGKLDIDAAVALLESPNPPSACAATSSCGDGTCDANEDCSSCASDCGTCSTCGDGTCDPDEDASSCSADCGSCGARKTPCTSGSECCSGICHPKKHTCN